MKRKLWMLAFGICIGGCVTGCGNSSSVIIQESVDATSTPVADETDVPTEELVEESTIDDTDMNEDENEYVLPSDFEEITQEEMDSLVNPELFTDNLDEGLETLGIYSDDILFTAYGNFVDDSDAVMTAQQVDVYIVVSDGHTLLANLDYNQVGRSDELITTTIRNSENNHAYYITEGFEDIIDLYDYETDDLLLEHSKDSDDIMDEYDEELDRIGEESDKRLDEIKEKYGLD